jgi:predicted secreted protein
MFQSPSKRIVCRLNKARRLALVIVASFSPAAFSQPQPQPPVPHIVTDTRTHADTGPLMTLQAVASAKVKQDTVRITLAVEVQALDQPAAGKKLSTLLDEVMNEAKDAKTVEVRTGAYDVWPATNANNKIVGWRGQGHIVLESKDFPAAAALAAKVGDKAAISNIDFFLSRAGREAEERKLLNQVAGAFRERALAAVSAFGFAGYRVIKLDLGGSGGYEAESSNAMPRMMAASPTMAKGASADVTTVPLQAGEVSVSVAVNGTIALQ